LDVSGCPLQTEAQCYNSEKGEEESGERDFIATFEVEKKRR
jgi:hypothetical protein